MAAAPREHAVNLRIHPELESLKTMHKLMEAGVAAMEKAPNPNEKLLSVLNLGKYITRANHMVSFNQIAVNEKVWQKISAEDQALIQQYIDEYTAKQQEEMYAAENAYYEKFEELGCIVQGFDPSEADQVTEAFQGYWDEYIANIKDGAAILEAIQGM